MPWAAGTYSKGNNGTGGWTGDASLGIGIEAGRHDTQDNDFATGINQCLNKDGSNSATADLAMGGFKHTNVANATARNNYAAVGQVQDGDFIWLGTTGGTATAQTASASPAITAYKAGQKFRMKIGAGLGSTGSTNTTHTLNVNSLGAQQILEPSGQSPTLGAWVAAAIMEVIYDGTYFFITNNPGGWLTYSPTLSASGSMTVSSVTTYNARFIKQNKLVSLIYNFQFTLGGTANNWIYLAPPIEIASSGVGRTTIGASYDTQWRPGLVSFNTATQIGQAQDTSGTPTWGLGSGRYISAYLVYESV